MYERGLEYRVLVLRYRPPGRSFPSVDDWPATRGVVPEWKADEIFKRIRDGENNGGVSLSVVVDCFLRWYLIPPGSELFLEYRDGNGTRRVRVEWYSEEKNL